LVSPGCSPATADCAQPDVYCVGLVTEVGRVDDRSYNQAAWEGIQQAKADGLADKTAFIETIDSRDYEENIRVLAEAGYDAIVTVGEAMSDATYPAAGEFTGTFFIGVDQRQPVNLVSMPNLVWLVFPEDRLGFLAGALAAAMTQTDRVGAVCGSDAWPPMKLYGDGFIAGALYINPDVIATVSYNNDVGLTETFDDPRWGAAAANSLLDAGADIIFGAGGTTGNSALETAAMRGAYVIGADTDQYYTLPAAAARMLTSVLKLISPGIVDLLQAAREAKATKGAFRSGDYYGQIGLAPYHDLSALIPDDVKQQISALPQALLSGEIRMQEPTLTP
jgi:basic membrane protein A